MRQASATRVSGHNVGVLLAVLAGCAELVEAVWPGSAPQSESLNFWLPLSVVSGCAFLLAAFMVDRHTVLARALLLVFGIGLVGSGVYFGLLSGGGTRSALAVAADLAPGLAALVAGLMIGPVERHVTP